MSWFHKITHPIQHKYIVKSLGREIQRNLTNCCIFNSGNVYINYNSKNYQKYKIWFWYVHFHEFLHRIFWKLKFPVFDKAIDYVDRMIFIHNVIKNRRMGHEV